MPKGIPAFKFVRSRKISETGNELVAMDYVLPCSNEECDIASRCPYKGETDKCVVHKEYIGNVIKMMYKLDAEGKIDDVKMHSIGVQMIPLYTHLFRFQLTEMSLNTPVVYGKSLYMHPVYKEIRNTTKLLFDMWRGMGLMDNVEVKEQAASSIYDIISGTEDIDEAEERKVVNDAVAKMVKLPKRDINNITTDDADVLYDDDTDGKIRVRLSKDELKKQDNQSDTAENIYEAIRKVEEGFTIEGDDGAEDIDLPAGFNPNNLPEASDVKLGE